MRRFERTAAHALTEFTRAAGAQILGSRQTDYVFPTRRGDRMTRQGLGFDVTRGAARAAHAHQKLTEAVVEFLDVSQDAHRRMPQAG